jgi:hypothetical protein
LVLTEKSNLNQSEAREFHLNPVATARANRTAHRLRERGTNVACSLADHTQRTAAFTRSGDRAIAWHDDRRLLRGDQLNCVAEILLMIESNVRHHRHAAIPGVHGVQATAESNFNHRPINASSTKPIKDDPRKQFKLRYGANGALHLISGAKRALYRRRKREWGERLAVDPDAFAVRDEVRLRRAAMPHAPCAKCCRDEGADAPLPICPCDERAAHPALGVSERLKKRNGALEPESDAEAATRTDCNLCRRPRLWAATLCDGGAHALACRFNLAPQRINNGGFGRKLWHLLSVAVNLLCVPQSGTWQGSIDPDRNRHGAAVSSATAVRVAAAIASQSDELIQLRQRAPQSPTHHNAHPNVAAVRLAVRSLR